MAVRTDRFFRLLADHHDVLEHLQNEKGVEGNRVREILHDFQDSNEDRSVEYRFKQLTEARIIKPITENHDNVYEVAAPVREILQYINEDYDLLGIESIESYFKTLDRNRRKLREQLESRDDSTLEARLEKIDRALINVRREVEQNRKAIESRVDEFNQAEGDNRSLKKQFQLIESLWEEYVQPLGKLVDPEGKPREILSKVSDLLQRGQQEYSHDETLENTFRITFQRLQNFLDLFRRSFDAVRREIKPLRRKYRHSDKYLEGASYFLESLRCEEKPAVPPDSWFKFPLARNEGLSDDDKIRNYLMKLFRYEPADTVELISPSEEDRSSYHSPFEIGRDLENRGDVGDVMEHLIERDEPLSVEVILQAYGYCFRNIDTYHQRLEPEEYNAGTKRIRLYPIQVGD